MFADRKFSRNVTPANIARETCFKRLNSKSFEYDDRKRADEGWKGNIYIKSKNWNNSI